MKPKLSLLVAATLLIAGLFSIHAEDTPPPLPPAGINPATGLPMARVKPEIIDAAKVPGLPTPSGIDPATQAWMDASQKVHELTEVGDYEGALQECLRFHAQCKGDHTVVPLVADWVKLGRRLPSAKEALIKIRDHDVGEFSVGRGYAVLFSEIKAINAALNDNEATYTLFKIIWDKDPALSHQCYGEAREVLMKKGEYALCLECLGDPQEKFESLRDDLQMRISLEQRQLKWQQDLAAHQEEMMKNNNRIWPRLSPPPRPDMARQATNNFAEQVVILEKILVGVGRTTDAEKIRAEALAVVDDPRLHATITDADLKAQ